MQILQLNPTIPLDTPKGPGYALFLTDYGPEHHLMFTVAIDATGELWTFDNTKVKAHKNVTMGRRSEDTTDFEKCILPESFLVAKNTEAKCNVPKNDSEEQLRNKSGWDIANYTDISAILKPEATSIEELIGENPITDERNYRTPLAGKF